MKHYLSFVCAIFVAAFSAFAGSLKPAEVAVDAKWFAHLDLNQLKASAIGQHILHHINADLRNQKARLFFVLFGIDLHEDVSAATAYGRSAQPEDGVVLLRGAFDQNRLTAHVQAKNAYERLSYGNYIIHTWQDQYRRRQAHYYAAMHGSNMLLFSQAREMLQAGLDVLDARVAGLSAADLQSLQTQGVAPVLIARGALDYRQEHRGNSSVLQFIEQGEVVLGEQDGAFWGRLNVSAYDEEAAASLFDMVNASIELAKTGGLSNPDLANLARALVLTKAGKAIRLDLKISNDLVIRLIDQKIAYDQARQEARRNADGI